MHELAVCQALLQELEALVVRHGAIRVQRLTVQVGALSGVEPQLLATAFEVARRGSCAEDAELTVESPQVRVRCRGCGTEADCMPTRLVCPRCGGARTELISGAELLLRHVELSLPTMQTPPCARPAAAP
jgi:hydrogenase nickel incorporation protein HypA/HybF